MSSEKSEAADTKVAALMQSVESAAATYGWPLEKLSATKVEVEVATGGERRHKVRVVTTSNRDAWQIWALVCKVDEVSDPWKMLEANAFFGGFGYFSSYDNFVAYGRGQLSLDDTSDVAHRISRVAGLSDSFEAMFSTADQN